MTTSVLKWVWALALAQPCAICMIAISVGQEYIDSWGAHGLHCQKSLAGNDIKWSKPLAKVSAHLKPAGYINQFRRDQVDKPYGQGADKCYSSLKALRTASKIPKVLARQILTDPQSLEALQS